MIFIILHTVPFGQTINTSTYLISIKIKILFSILNRTDFFLVICMKSWKELTYSKLTKFRGYSLNTVLSHGILGCPY